MVIFFISINYGSEIGLLWPCICMHVCIVVIFSLCQLLVWKSVWFVCNNDVCRYNTNPVFLRHCSVMMTILRSMLSRSSADQLQESHSPSIKRFLMDGAYSHQITSTRVVWQRVPVVFGVHMMQFTAFLCSTRKDGSACLIMKVIMFAICLKWVIFVLYHAWQWNITKMSTYMVLLLFKETVVFVLSCWDARVEWTMMKLFKHIWKLKKKIQSGLI